MCVYLLMAKRILVIGIKRCVPESLQVAKTAVREIGGGPIMVKAGDDWALAGVVSWGRGCGVSGSFGVYAEAAYFQKWIEERSFRCNGDWCKQNRVFRLQ